MGRIRGFLLKNRVKTLFRRVLRRRRKSIRLVEPNRAKPLDRLMKWANRISTKAKAIMGKKAGSGRACVRLGQEPVPVPKGYMAVYVGQKDGVNERVLVPVVYFNHPLFGSLLKESEKEYGFDHPGGITIPCRVSEFERVQTRIQAVQCTRKLWSGKIR